MERHWQKIPVSVCAFKMSVLAIFVYATCFGQSAFGQEKSEWYFSKAGRDGQVSLTYGARGNDELTQIYFACSPGTGAVHITVVESSSKLKPGDTACLALTVGQIQTGVCGAATPNELAGIPTFEAIIGINEPIFSALQTTGTLGIHIAGDHTTIALAGAATAAGRFFSACRYSAP